MLIPSDMLALLSGGWAEMWTCELLVRSKWTEFSLCHTLSIKDTGNALMATFSSVPTYDHHYPQLSTWPPRDITMERSLLITSTRKTSTSWTTQPTTWWTPSLAAARSWRSTSGCTPAILLMAFTWINKGVTCCVCASRVAEVTSERL